MSDRRFSLPINVVLAFLAGVLLVAAIAGAQDTRPALTRPSTTSEGSITLKGRITGVRGLVEVKVTEKSVWAAAREGMVVDEGAEFRTGPRGAVQIVIEPDQTITLDRLGTIKLLTAVRQASGKTKTDIGMKYGRTRYDISAGGLEHESTIRSPNSTLAVRGTKVSLTDTRPFPPEAVSLIGRAEFQSFKRQVVAFGGKAKAKIDSSEGSTAGTALESALLDPVNAFSRDSAEQALVADVISRGATVTLDRETGFRTVTGGTVPNDKELLSLLPGNLNFVLRWDGPANLDLVIGFDTKSNGSRTLYPNKELFFTPEGGRIPFDHQGGPSGGFEIASFPANFDRVSYGAGVNHVSGPIVNATFQAYVNGQPQQILAGFHFDPSDPNTPIPDFTDKVSKPVAPIPPNAPGQREAAILGTVDLSDVPVQNSRRSPRATIPAAPKQHPQRAANTGKK